MNRTTDEPDMLAPDPVELAGCPWCRRLLWLHAGELVDLLAVRGRTDPVVLEHLCAGAGLFPERTLSGDRLDLALALFGSEALGRDDPGALFWKSATLLAAAFEEDAERILAAAAHWAALHFTIDQFDRFLGLAGEQFGGHAG